MRDFVESSVNSADTVPVIPKKIQTYKFDKTVHGHISLWPFPEQEE